MVVTCESCQSKYKLDDSKITGRGAKITCPKCKHVFVVYTQPAEAPAPVAPVPRPAPAAVAAPPPEPEPPEDEDWEDDQPTRVAVAAPPLRNSVREARHLPASAPSNPTLAIPEGDDHNVAYLPPPARAAVSAADAASRAATLDFKKVGISAWKVKVKIGIVYDFSDIKTLRKYIQDGRVTPTDVISHDGKSWRPIGEIADLDAFFVETYDRLERERAAAAAPPPVPPAGVTATPSSPAGVEPPLNTEERAKLNTEERAKLAETSTFRDPFEEAKSKQRERAAQRRAGTTLPPPGTPGGGSRLAMAVTVVAVLVAGGAAAWWYTRSAPPPAPTSTTKTTTAPPPAADVKSRLDETLAGSLTKKEPTTVPPPAPVMPPPTTAITPTTVLPAGIPEGAVPVIPSDARRATSGTSGGTATTTQRTADTVRTGEATAADHEVMGDASARAGDWSGAVRGYSNAVALDPNNGRLLKKLGEAQYRAGDLDGAAATLQKAASLGQKDAYKLLGAVARAQGDTAGASAYYQQYLATNPRDAAEIQRILAELSAG